MVRKIFNPGDNTPGTLRIRLLSIQIYSSVFFENIIMHYVNLIMFWEQHI